ncbi:unnamed protein product [Darwinula stevensoni]|uniref:Uncharacterized protein n=1 Tax=Darwinula stevensoni TaxID=69355 RepID=A0A7R8X5S2_9CRUS|nr:unnamed protein product [Darwinula stevensoni]CAG0885093.1 unnamed protein product [Darwinula stevensoni]
MQEKESARRLFSFPKKEVGDGTKTWNRYSESLRRRVETVGVHSCRSFRHARCVATGSSMPIRRGRRGSRRMPFAVCCRFFWGPSGAVVRRGERLERGEGGEWVPWEARPSQTEELHFLVVASNAGAAGSVVRRLGALASGGGERKEGTGMPEIVSPSPSAERFASCGSPARDGERRSGGASPGSRGRPCGDTRSFHSISSRVLGVWSGEEFRVVACVPCRIGIRAVRATSPNIFPKSYTCFCRDTELPCGRRISEEDRERSGRSRRSVLDGKTVTFGLDRNLNRRSASKDASAEADAPFAEFEVGRWRSRKWKGPRRRGNGEMPSAEREQEDPAFVPADRLNVSQFSHLSRCSRRLMELMCRSME